MVIMITRSLSLVIQYKDRGYMITRWLLNNHISNLSDDVPDDVSLLLREELNPELSIPEPIPSKLLIVPYSVHCLS